MFYSNRSLEGTAPPSMENATGQFLYCEGISDPVKTVMPVLFFAAVSMTDYAKNSNTLIRSYIWLSAQPI